ncbi:Ferritin like protein [Aduncisulcus paluster]|uniref:Ferritin n=1 Tax=Aduncisulcus paluster TaxID=2918883 RepID=A0ABQ5K0W8_9EUKA|nr:Ferritin like protein [Aduncisulcus paluster]
MPKLSPTLIAKLNKQMMNELHAFITYEQLSMWAQLHLYCGIAAYFSEQAKEEFEHYKKYKNFLLERGVKPSICAIEAPISAEPNVLSHLKTALRLEEKNSASILDLRETAEKEKDVGTVLFTDYFVKEQELEEARLGGLIEVATKVQSATGEGLLFQLDSMIAKFV